MSGLVKLNVIGLTYSQTQSSAYALVLGEENGSRRIPIVIGASEAQSIAMNLQGLTPTRPLTHDLFVSLLDAYGIALQSVTIYKFEKEVFYSELIFKNEEGHEIKMDSRTSDAIALAVRTQTPIYTTEAIMSETSVFFEDEGDMEANSESEDDDVENDAESFLDDGFPEITNIPLSELTEDELKEQLEIAVKGEDYERAMLINEELKKRK